MMLRVYAHNETNFEHNGLAILNKATNVKISREINGDYRLTFDLPADDGKWKYLKQRNFVTCEGQKFRIYKKSRQKEGIITRTVECLHVISDANSHIPYFDAQIGRTPREIMVAAFANTPFTVMTEYEINALGMEWVTDLTDIVEPLSKTTPLEIVRIVIEQIQKGELYIDNYKIALVKRIGRDTGRQCTLKSIGDTEDSSNLITRLYAYGKDDLPLPNETGYIDSPEGIELFGIVEGYIDFDTVTDPDELMEKAQWEFSPDNPYRKDLPDLAYDATFVELYKLFGNNFKINLGDGIKIRDSELGIETTQRITKYEWYPYGHQQSTVTFGRAPKTYADMLQSLQGTQSAYDKIVTQNGNIKASWLENIRRNKQTKVNDILLKREVVEHKTGDIWVNPNDPDKAMLISDSIFAIANGRTPDGDYAWLTFGDAEGFVGDAFKANSIHANKLIAETIQLTNLNQDLQGVVNKADAGLDDNGDLITKVLPGDNIGTPDGAGLYLGKDYMGYYSGSEWSSFINNQGQFTFKGNNNNYISWNGFVLDIKGKIQADSGYIASGLAIGPGGSYTVGDLATEEYALGVADDAYYDATDYTENYADGTWTMIGAKLKSTDGNLVLNSTVGGVPYYLYAVKNGKGFYVDTNGNALFTGSVTGSSIYGSNFYGTGTNSGYIKVGNLGSNADLSLYRGGGSYPTFRIYDGTSYIALQSRTDSSLSPITFLEIINSTVKPYGNWNFSNASLNFSGASITGLYAKYA